LMHRRAKGLMSLAVATQTAAEMQKITGGLQLPPGMKLPF
jgi:hypothetical protein